MRERVILVVITVTLTIVGEIVFSSFVKRENKLENTVDKEYVDMQDSKIIKEYKSADKIVEERCMSKINNVEKSYQKEDKNIKGIVDNNFKMLLEEIRINRRIIIEKK